LAILFTSSIGIGIGNTYCQSIVIGIGNSFPKYWKCWCLFCFPRLPVLN